MNELAETNKIKWLFLDLNAYFASCEQQETPSLRDRPLVVVQTITENACAIAASYAAKRLGITTGTLLREARQICPQVIPVKARHSLYAEYHEKILQAVDTCVPVEKVLSIDEMACRLMGPETEIPNAQALAKKIKRTLKETVGECMTCSIGLAPNVFLGKIGSDLQKPDGLVTLPPSALPGPVLTMKLQDIYGIGPRMEARLNRFGICTASDLWNASPERLRLAWNGINGLLFHRQLHGADIEPAATSHTKSIGHQHVLEPELRTQEGAKDYARHLLAKAAERLRRSGYYAQKLGLQLSPCGPHNSWWDDIGFHETQDTSFLLARLEDLWRHVPRMKPLAVNVVLLNLVPVEAHQPDLFASNPRKEKLSPLIDQINGKFGRNAVGFGLLSPKVRIFKGHAAFRRVPEKWEF